MSSFNQATLLGRLGKDAEMRYTPGGTAVAELSLATDNAWADKQGERKKDTEWHRVKVWGKMAERMTEYLVKGKQILVVGRISTRSYDDRDGKKRYITEIVASQIQLLGGRDGSGGPRRNNPPPETAPVDEPAPVSSDELTDADIPF